MTSALSQVIEMNKSLKEINTSLKNISMVLDVILIISIGTIILNIWNKKSK